MVDVGKRELVLLRQHGQSPERTQGSVAVRARDDSSTRIKTQMEVSAFARTMRAIVVRHADAFEFQHVGHEAAKLLTSDPVLRSRGIFQIMARYIAGYPEEHITRV